MTDEKIARINALAKKAKTEGLTDAEKKEQQELRAEYVDACNFFVCHIAKSP